MSVFKTKEDLATTWAKEQPDYKNEDTFISTWNGKKHVLGASQCRHLPHLDCGGWVMPGFGYSTERIGRAMLTKKTPVIRNE